MCFSSGNHLFLVHLRDTIDGNKYLAFLRVLLYDFEGFKDDGFYSGIFWVVGESEWDSLVLLHFL